MANVVPSTNGIHPPGGACTSVAGPTWSVAPDAVLDAIFGLLHTRERLNRIEHVCRGWTHSSKRGCGWQTLLEMNWDTKLNPNIESIADRIKGHRIQSIHITIEPHRSADLIYLLSRCSALLQKLTLHRIGSGMMFEVLSVLTSAKAPFYKLTHLSLRPTAVYDIEMIFPRLPLVQHLDIGYHASQYASDTLSAIFYLNEMENLRSLTCTQRNIRLAIAGLTHSPPKLTWASPKLEVLNVLSDSIHVKIWKHMIDGAAALRDVRALWLDPQQVEYLINKAPNLTRLEVTEWYGVSLELVRGLPQLTHLGIGNDLSQEGFNAWDNLSYLTKLVTLNIIIPAETASRVALLEVIHVLANKYELRRINDAPVATFVALCTSANTAAAALGA